MNKVRLLLMDIDKKHIHEAVNDVSGSKMKHFQVNPWVPNWVTDRTNQIHSSPSEPAVFICGSFVGLRF